MSIPTRSTSTSSTNPIWSPDTLTSSPGAAAVFEFDASNSADFKTNASGAVTEVLNSLNTSQYLLAEGTPIRLASGQGAKGQNTELAFVPTYISPNNFDPTTNWLSAGGLKGPDQSLVSLANSSNLSSEGSFTAVIAMDILGAGGSKPAPYEAGPLWGAPQVPGPFQYIQLRENPGTGKQGANLADAVSNSKGAGAVNPQGGVTTGWHVLTMIKGSGALTYRLDGKTIATAAITATDAFTSTDFMIGGGFAPGASGENGVPAPYVGEFQAYSGVLSSADLANAEALAATSIGITLPTTPTIALSAPGTLQESSIGAGVTVNETITTTNLTGSVYAEVLTASGSVETSYQPIALSSTGATIASIHLGKTGDVIKVVNNTTSPTVSQTSTPVTITDPIPSIALSAPGTVQEASVGAGVTISETITTTNLTGTVYAEVLTASGGVETSYQPIILASNGVTTASIHLGRTGDVIKVVNNTTSPTISQTSTPVTITDPSAQKLTAVLPSPLYVGAETVTGTGGVAGLQLERITQGTYNAPGQAGWVRATVAADGTWSVPLTFTKAGMLAHVYAENGGSSTVVDLIDGTPVAAPTPTPTPTPVPSIALSAPGTVQEASVGAGVTITETITTTNLTGSVYAEVLTASGTVESSYQPVTLASNGVTTASIHLGKTGDAIQVTNSLTTPTVTTKSAAVTITDPTPAPSPTPVPTPTLTAMLPSPLYTGIETVTGTGGVSGLRLERITQGTTNTPGQSGWVDATVAANGHWSAQLTFTKPGMLAHVYAQNGAIGAVVDLIDGTPVQAPSTAVASRTVSASIATDMTSKAASAVPASAMVQTSASHGGTASFPAASQAIAAIVPDTIKVAHHFG